jgi:hypothetical protein
VCFAPSRWVSILGDDPCHAERSEVSVAKGGEMLRYAQHDNGGVRYDKSDVSQNRVAFCIMVVMLS